MRESKKMTACFTMSNNNRIYTYYRYSYAQRQYTHKYNQWPGFNDVSKLVVLTRESTPLGLMWK